MYIPWGWNEVLLFMSSVLLVTFISLFSSSLILFEFQVTQSPFKPVFLSNRTCEQRTWKLTRKALSSQVLYSFLFKISNTVVFRCRAL